MTFTVLREIKEMINIINREDKFANVKLTQTHMFRDGQWSTLITYDIINPNTIQDIIKECKLQNIHIWFGKIGIHLQ